MEINENTKQYLEDNVERGTKITWEMTARGGTQRLKNGLCLEMLKSARSFMLFALERFVDKDHPEEASPEIQQMIMDLDKAALKFITERTVKEVSKKVNMEVVKEMLEHEDKE